MLNPKILAVEERLMTVFDAFARNRLLTAVRNGFVGMMPFMIVGAFAILINNLPLPAYIEFMETMFGENWKFGMDQIVHGTFSIMSLGILLSITHAIISLNNERLQEIEGAKINPMIPTLLSLGCFFTLARTDLVEGGGIDFTHIGSQGVFISVVVAVSVPHLFFWLYRYRYFGRKPLVGETDNSLFSQAIMSILPCAVVFAVFMLIHIGLQKIGVEDVHTALYSFLETIFLDLGNGLLSVFICVLMIQLFWFFGIHGNNVLESMIQRVSVDSAEKNAALIAQGLPPSELFTKQFLDCFVIMGGTGATLCLILAILLRARKSAAARVAKLSIPMGIFNINETMTFGLPLVLNPLYLIPFICVPLIFVLTTTAAMSLGLVPFATESVNWTTPILISGYQATGKNIAGSIFQLFNLALGTAIYTPFVIIAERAQERQNQRVVKKLNDEVNYVQTNRVLLLIPRQDEIGSLARTLANDLKHSIKENKELYLVYQPQIDNNEKLAGCEVLLRYNHAKYGFIPPPTIITIAEEAGIDDELNEWIFKTALTAARDFRARGYKDLVVSINISPVQLKNNRIYEILEKAIKQYNLDPDKLEIELTENISIEESDAISGIFERFTKLGVRLAIDDFGMGHTSLMYLKTYPFNTVKLDGSLVESIIEDPNTESIVTTVMDLANRMNMHVVAEVVETKEQRDKLKALGCHIYQGYYYSRPLPEGDFTAYADKNLQASRLIGNKKDA